MSKVVRVELDFKTLNMLVLRKLGDEYIADGKATVRVAGWKVVIHREGADSTFEEFNEDDKGEAIRYAIEASTAHNCQFIDLTKEST